MPMKHRSMHDGGTSCTGTAHSDPLSGDPKRRWMLGSQHMLVGKSWRRWKRMMVHRARNVPRLSRPEHSAIRQAEVVVHAHPVLIRHAHSRALRVPRIISDAYLRMPNTLAQECACLPWRAQGLEQVYLHPCLRRVKSHKGAVSDTLMLILAVPADG